MTEDAYGQVTARYYDRAYAGRPELARDTAFYLSLAREGAGPVLELGCGTGRVLLAIAAEGIPCTGLDASQAMLSALRAKGPPPTLRLVRAPMQRFELGSDRFTLIYSAFRAFQHLYTVEDQLACLACVRRHLAPGGLLAFDVFNPRLDRLALAEERELEDVRFADGDDEIARHVSVTRDTSTQVQRVRMRYQHRRGGAPVAEDLVEFDMRWFYRFEVEHLLARAGFELAALYGDFDRSAFAASSPAIIAVARAAPVRSLDSPPAIA
jgi:SAM-dependent methyltransferase